MEDEACNYAFGHEGDDSPTIARKISEFQPDGLVVRKGRITREVLEACDRLRAVCKHGVGVDNIDITAATDMGIPVMITAWANFESVAEHTLGLILAVLRNLHRQHAYTRSGRWDKSNYEGQDLLGKTLGLVGLGRIGQRLCELVAPFRMKLLAYDPYLPAGQFPPAVQKVPDVRTMLPLVDILSIHCPLTSETEGLIGQDELALLRHDAYLINTARGRIVDETALIKALQDGAISGVALDTFEQEPPDSSNPLFAMDNVIVTNHVGGSSRDALRNMGVDAVRNILGILKGNRPRRSCVVNPAVFENRTREQEPKPN
jgi:D-3-phosphoglycerate dehydrogenase